MLTMIVGGPGSGKSYESVVYEILETVREGRKVVTNIPVRREAFRTIDPEYASLVTVIYPTEDNVIPFSTISDYRDDWEHPDKPGVRARFVIDEAHECVGTKCDVPRDVVHWYAKHRHYGHDVVLVTQNQGNIYKQIRDLTEYTVKLKRLVLLGAHTRYLRFVYDGTKTNSPISRHFRRYDPRYFGLYQSFTGGGAAITPKGQPVWRNWKMIGAATAGLLLMANTAYHGLHWPGMRGEAASAAPVPAAAVPAQPVSPAGPPVRPKTRLERMAEEQAAHEVAKREADEKKWKAFAERPAVFSIAQHVRREGLAAIERTPFPLYGIGISSWVEVGERVSVSIWVQAASRPGDWMMLTAPQLDALGLEFRATGRCEGRLWFRGSEQWARSVECREPETEGELQKLYRRFVTQQTQTKIKKEEHRFGQMMKEAAADAEKSLPKPGEIPWPTLTGPAAIRGAQSTGVVTGPAPVTTSTAAQ